MLQPGRHLKHRGESPLLDACHRQDSGLKIGSSRQLIGGFLEQAYKSFESHRLGPVAPRRDQVREAEQWLDALLGQVIVSSRNGLARGGDFPREAFLGQFLLRVVEDREAQADQLFARLVELALEVLDPQVFFLYVEAGHREPVAVQPVEGNQLLGEVPRGGDFAGRVTDREGKFGLVISRRVRDKLFKGPAVASRCQGIFLPAAGE
ncbi:hypothetical protein EBZ80_11275 [bacterium]|nr:hypothetical protein [bacterium]